jgi:uncharacterized damage-inducible protein DinB
MAREDVDAAVSGLTGEQLWAQPGGIASLGFHLAHLSGSTDRLVTYALGQSLSESQKEALRAERTLSEVRPSLDVLVADWHRTIAGVMDRLAAIQEATLLDPRAVGRAQLPSTVLGLLFHAAEHASRHTGQVVTTAKLIRGLARGADGS